MDALGIFAAVCSTSASMPQLCTEAPQTLRLSSIALRCVGGVAWTVYGALREDYPLTTASGIVALVEIILWAKRRRALDQIQKDGVLHHTTPSQDVFSPVTDAGTHVS